jgi:hypothetical protein
MECWMDVSQLVFFIGWLAVALTGGALLVVVWERLRVKYRAR